MSPESSGMNGQDSETLAQRIKSAASEGNFAEAERLREQLLQVDSMALSLIVSTGEFIEEQKSKFLDPDHLAAWQDLYEDFTSEEVNTLFYSLKPAKLAAGKLLLAQGKINNRLFFIESGKISVFYRKENKNIPVIQLGRGDILGEDTFFGISLCPLSAGTQTEVDLRHLNRSEAECWHETQPGLFEKLGDYCRRNGKSDLAVKQKSINRRSFGRYPVAGVATAHLVNEQGDKTATYFKGGLIDISRNGVSFSMKCSKQETARALLSREVDVSLSFDDLPDQQFVARGNLVKLTFHLHNDYSVHVKLHELIDAETFKAFPCDWSADKE